MKQVVQSMKTGSVSVLEVPPPQLRPRGALVVVRASLISAGTERTKIELGEKSLIGKARARPELARQVAAKARRDGLRETYTTVMQRLEAPGALGYSAAGHVLEVGSDCPGVEPGDLVACAGGGYANHAEVGFVPRNLLARVPDGVTVEQAAYATLGAIAMQGVRQADVRLGERVAIIGLGLVGLLAVQLARAAGGRVLAVDIDPAACAVAAQVGAEVIAPRDASVEAAAAAFTDGVGVDTVLVCASTASNDPIELAARLCRDRGRVVVVGAVGMTVPRDPFYEKELDLRLSRSYGPGRYDPEYEEHGQDYPIGYVRWTEQRNLEEFMRLVRDGLVDVDTLTTHRFAVEDAPDAYALVAGRVESETRPIGVLLTYAGDASAARSRVDVPVVPRRTVQATVGLAVVGAGSFASRVLLPALVADERVRPVGVATATGVTARDAASRFGFGYATSDPQQLLDDPDVDAVAIATRHDSHAFLAAAAIAAGKTVFCEKPLATTWAGLEGVAAAYAAAPAPFLVGFNRRFSPHAAALRAALIDGVPRAILCRVNAGQPPAHHWTQDPLVGGGRIVGELCHFLDLACYFVEGRPVRVAAMTLGGGARHRADSVVVQVSFACGSVASVQYLANGDPSVAKERIEVFCGGATGLIDDFRRLEIVQDGRRTRTGGRRQEKGHSEELRAFVDLAAGGTSDVLSVEDIFWSSALTLQVPEALRLGRPVEVELPASLAAPVAAQHGGRAEPAAAS
jgi:predicted dehydrogenase/threonine dehydrogenase-like Zn-dependent dehydrogenase